LDGWLSIDFSRRAVSHLLLHHGILLHERGGALFKLRLSLVRHLERSQVLVLSFALKDKATSREVV
jgi:hypothetical protein